MGISAVGRAPLLWPCKVLGPFLERGGGRWGSPLSCILERGGLGSADTQAPGIKDLGFRVLDGFLLLSASLQHKPAGWALPASLVLLAQNFPLRASVPTLVSVPQAQREPRSGHGAKVTPDDEA